MCLQTDNPLPGVNPWTTSVASGLAIAQMKAAYDAWKEQLDKINADLNKYIWEAVKKILMEYIDDPFTCDPSTASREEFARRHINAVVFAEIGDWENLRVTIGLMGVVQGDTLIVPNGDRIKNYNWKQGRPKPEIPTYKDGLFESIKLENLEKIKLVPSGMERLRNSLDSFGPIYDKDNDNG